MLANKVSIISSRGVPKKPLRKNEKPLVCFLRLYGPEKRRMNALTNKRRGAHNDIAMAGTLSEMRRLENEIPGVRPEVAKALAEIEALKIDPLPHLEAIIKDAVESPLAVHVGLPATI